MISKPQQNNEVAQLTWYMVHYTIKDQRRRTIYIVFCKTSKMMYFNAEIGNERYARGIQSVLKEDIWIFRFWFAETESVNQKESLQCHELLSPWPNVCKSRNTASPTNQPQTKEVALTLCSNSEWRERITKSAVALRAKDQWSNLVINSC